MKCVHSLRYSSITANKNWILISGTHICIPEGIVTCSPNYQIRSFFLSYPSQVFRGWGKCLVDVADTWALIGRPSLIFSIYLSHISFGFKDMFLCVHTKIGTSVCICFGSIMPGQNVTRCPMHDRLSILPELGQKS